MKLTPIKGKRKIFKNMVLSNNLVLIQMIGLCPIIAGATTLKNAVALTICTFFTILPTSIYMSLVGRKLSRSLHPVFYGIFAMAILFFMSWFIHVHISTELYASLYLLLPLLAINMLVAYHNNDRASNLRLDFLESFSTSIGFGIIICIVGFVREFVAFNTIWGIPTAFHHDIPQASLSFAAFILLGLMAGFLQWINKLIAKKEVPSEEEVANDE